MLGDIYCLRNSVNNKLIVSAIAKGSYMTFSADRHVDFYIGPQSSNGFNNGIISFQAEGGIKYYQLQNNQPILLWSIDSINNPGTSYIPY